MKGQNKIIYQDKKNLKFLVESKKYGNCEVLIDIEDWNKVKIYHWYLSINKNPNIFIISCNINNKKNKHTTLKLHRLILNLTDPKIIVDHKFGNTLDNQKENLRICSIAENNRNQKLSKNNISGYKGVHWNKTKKKWHVTIGHNNKLIFLGYFENKTKAAKIYNQAAIKYHKEFAKLNEI